MLIAIHETVAPYANLFYFWSLVAAMLMILVVIDQLWRKHE